MTTGRWQVFIAHAVGEEGRAEQLAGPIRAAGYEVVHGGTVLVGDSILAEASKALSLGGPVVVCATIEAVGTGWANEIVQAARKNGAKVFVVRMQPQVYTNMLAADEVVAEYWKDPEAAMKALIKALRAHYPLLEKRMAEVEDEVSAGVRSSAQRSTSNAHINQNFIGHLQRVIDWTRPATNVLSFMAFIACLAAIIFMSHPFAVIVAILAVLAVAVLTFLSALRLGLRATVFPSVKPWVVFYVMCGAVIAMTAGSFRIGPVMTALESPMAQGVWNSPMRQCTEYYPCGALANGSTAYCTNIVTCDGVKELPPPSRHPSGSEREQAGSIHAVSIPRSPSI